MNRSRPPGTVVPVLIYEDVGAALDWLCETFGFTERLRAGQPGGRVEHGQLAVGDGSVILGAVRRGQSLDRADHAEFRPPDPAEVTHYVNVHAEDVDLHHERAVRQGARILHPPTDYPFGERQYTAEDLAGHRWTFSQSIADVVPESWGAERPISG